MAPRILLTAVLIVVHLLIPGLSEWLSIPIFIGSIVSIGMLHGGLDHLTAFRHFSLNDEQRKWPWFLGGYMAIIGVYGLIWLVSVPLGLALFILLSCYHFGQLDMHEKARSAWRKPLYLSRGVFLLGLMITAQIESVAGVIQPVMATGFLIDFITDWQISLVAFIIIQHSVLLLFGTHKLSASLVTDTVITGLMFGLLPPLLSFGLYFALWHSWDHLQLLNRYLKLPDWWSLIRNALPFTLLALAGIAGILVLFGQSLQQPGAVIYALIGISLLTMPHMLLVDRVVEHDH